MKFNQEILRPVVVLALIAIVISGVGFVVYESQFSNAPETGLSEPEISDGFVKYQNEELGLLFFYPKEWGEVKYETGTRNPEKWEPVKSHFLDFSNSPNYIVISPSDWKFTGPESEWNLPPLYETTFDNYRNRIVQAGGDSLSILLNTNKELVSLSYSEFDDSLYLGGIKLVSLPKINAEYIQLIRNDFDFDHSCLKEHENEYGLYYVALDCVSPQDREEFIETLKSINSI